MDAHTHTADFEHPLERPCGPSTLVNHGSAQGQQPPRWSIQENNDHRNLQIGPILMGKTPQISAERQHVALQPSSSSGDTIHDPASEFASKIWGDGPLWPDGEFALPTNRSISRPDGQSTSAKGLPIFSTRSTNSSAGFAPDSIPIIPVDPRVKRAQKAVDYKSDISVCAIVRKNRWLSVDLRAGRLIRLNWVVLVLSTSIIWAVIVTIVCLADTNANNGKRIIQTLPELNRWWLWTVQNFSWLFIISRNVYLLVVLWLAFSKHGSVMLGKKTETPEFDDLSWFSMIVCCGLGMALWSTGVSTSMAHYRSLDGNRLVNTPFQNDDGRAQQAIFMTIYFHGLHAWVVYVLVALSIGVVAYRWDLPVSLRYAFFPVLGQVVEGLAGDVLEAIAVASTCFALSTSLGFGVQTILTGLRRLDCAFVSSVSVAQCIILGDSRVSAANDSVAYMRWQVGTVWVLASLIVFSQMIGIRWGIGPLAVVGFLMGTCLVLLLLFLDNTWYVLNSFVQSLGHYAHYLVLVGFKTDSLEQLAIEFQSAPSANQLWDSKADKLYTPMTSTTNLPLSPSAAASYFESHSSDWMRTNTMFYWALWATWAPAIGVFLARISRGRSIRQVVLGALVGPAVYTAFTLVVFASLGIKMQRTLEVALSVPPPLASRAGMAAATNCTALGLPTAEKLLSLQLQREPGLPLKLAELGWFALACRSTEEQVWDVLQPYGPQIGKLLGCMAVVSMALCLVASLNAVSLVHDVATAGGLLDTPYIQRLYWALTEAACATTLIVMGGQDALTALQSLSLSLALPYTIAFSIMCTALVRACQYDDLDSQLHLQTRFLTGLLDWTEGFRPLLVTRLYLSPAAASTRSGSLPPPMPSVAERLASLLIGCCCCGWRASCRIELACCSLPADRSCCLPCRCRDVRGQQSAAAQSRSQHVFHTLVDV